MVARRSLLLFLNDVDDDYSFAVPFVIVFSISPPLRYSRPPSTLPPPPPTPPFPLPCLASPYLAGSAEAAAKAKSFRSDKTLDLSGEAGATMLKTNETARIKNINQISSKVES